MKQEIVKQTTGVDVAQKELVAAIGRMFRDMTTEIYARKAFANNEKGFKELTVWVAKQTVKEIPVRFVMEATGVYHEAFAYYLDGSGYEASIVMPAKISNYFKTLDIKTVTDASAAYTIALFGLERKLDQWQKPNQQFRELRQATRERTQLIDERSMLKNQLHAEKAEAFPYEKTIQRLNERIKMLNSQLKQIDAEILKMAKADKQIHQTVTNLCTVSGIGLLSAATILAETNGFELIRNKKQLTSFAGLDVKEKQSGTSVKGKPRISKKGNRYLRKAMYMPALTAIRTDERFKAVFARLVSKHGIKMKAVVAVQRKLLELAYIIYKTNKPYAKDYLQQQNEEINRVAA
jgi:transposase